MCPAHPRAMLYALKIVTDVSLFARLIFHTYHVFVGGAMMTIRCIASNFMIVCPCDDGDYAEFFRSARISASNLKFSSMSADARFAWISFAAALSVRALHSSNMACVV